MTEQHENPYQTPLAAPQANISGKAEFEHLDDKQLKKLYYRSSNISCITALQILGLVCLISIPLFSLSFGDSIVELGPIFYVLIVFNIVVAGGLITRTSWGRVLGIIVCILALINIPIGTLIGIVGLVALIAAPELFGDDRITHKSLKEEFKLRKVTAKLKKAEAKKARA